MTPPSPQFYFTKLDPDYAVKGSRDPLGFQVIWQHQARQLIPFLSTVSGNVHDFQIMCLAHYFYGREADTQFVPYFLRFEQLMAYARYQEGGAGFNGIDRVRRKIADGGRLSISTQAADQILSNQRAYGIWGKYNRPFQDIGFLEDERFEPVFSKKLASLPDASIIIKLAKGAAEKAQLRLYREELDVLKPLLQLSKQEKTFFRDKLLLLQRANPYQNRLYSFFTRTEVPKGFAFYPLLQQFMVSELTADDNLQQIVNEMEATEKILAPLNRIFRYLQTRPLWRRSELEVDSYIEQCKAESLFVFPSISEENKTKNNLSIALQLENWALMETLVKRNAEVTAWRGGAPWLTISNDILEMHHAEGGFYDPNFHPEQHNDNYYFIDTYRNLFTQLH